jgi:hypothetical protein
METEIYLPCRVDMPRPPRPEPVPVPAPAPKDREWLKALIFAAGFSAALGLGVVIALSRGACS